MYAMILSAILNIVLDPILIYILGLGVAGAALATLISTGSVLLVLYYWMFVKKDTYLNPYLSNFKFSRQISLDILGVGIPASLEMIMTACIRSINGDENRPGVAGEILSADEAVAHVEKVTSEDLPISVVGVAGPGDSLANDATFEFFEKITEEKPEMIKCMSTNGLLLPKYAERIAELGIDTLTVTVNAVDPEIGKDIYGFVIYEGEVYKGKGAPLAIGSVFSKILTDMISNPVTALIEGKYISILFWAIVFGLSFKKVGNEKTLELLGDLADMISHCVRMIIQLAPFGIMGIIFKTITENGLDIFISYGQLLALIVGCVLIVALVTDPFLSAITLRRNPYPLVLTCIKESGITAFFTRSSAANIPVNLELCRRLGLDENFYGISIPLGSTINMEG